MFVYQRWTVLQGMPRDPATVVAFHTAHKLTLMAHAPTLYREAGRIAARAGSAAWDETTDAYGRVLMRAVERLTTVRKHTDALHHAAGFLKHVLDGGDREELAGTIEQVPHREGAAHRAADAAAPSCVEARRTGLARRPDVPRSVPGRTDAGEQRVAMRVLITGATGFVGRALVRALAERGNEPVALTRDPGRALTSLPELAHAHTWRPLEGSPPPEAFESVDAVVNLMGESVEGRWTTEKKRAILETRETGTRNLVLGMQEAARTGAPVRILVSASANGYYGDRGEEELTEETAQGAGFLSDVCGRWEAAASEAAASGARVVLLRTGLVAGRGAGFLAPLSRLTRLGISGPLGSGRQWWPWVHLDDVIGLILHALDNEAVQGPVNACAPAPVRQRELAKALGRVLHRPALLPAPAFALRLVLGGFAPELLNSRRAVPAAALASGYAFRYPELDTALRDIYA